uniref:Blo t 5 allergen n=1 Tax=Blomia tropicalis TaxID=40697 RepID=A0A1P8DF97_BLOTA|nr:Blo t 5 allergen [Blomia tropicalis]
MKFAIVLIACFAASVLAQEHKPKKDDFRNEFDHLLIEQVNHAIEKGEHQLLYLQHQLDELNENKSKELQEKIIRELDVVCAMIEGAQGALERELKRTDLNILERFNYEEAQTLSKILLKDLKETEQKVKDIQTQ